MASTAVAQRPRFSVAIQTDGYQRLINNTLQDPKRAQRFIASISSAVAVNPDLQECDAGTILTCALQGEALNLSPSPQLGQYYLVPFNDNKNNRKVATFIIGYKGYIQLAARSGQYKYLNVIAIKKGELVSYNPLTEELTCNFITDELKRETAPTIGYYAVFEYMNGFKKALYWSRDKMEQHALRYSAGYKAKKGYTYWEKDFDGMAYKTMLRQLISKWGIMSIEMRDALEKDNSVGYADGSMDYIGGDDIAQITSGVQDAAEGTAEGLTVDDSTGEVIEAAVGVNEEDPAQITMNEL